jgi:signal transduction histidine kinase
MAARSSLQPAAPSRARAPSGELPIVRPDIGGMVAHDLKTPLSTIALNLEYVLDELGPDAPEGLRSALEDCVAANSLAVRIASEVAEASRLGRDEPTPGALLVDASDVVRRALAALAPQTRDAGASLSHHLDPTPSHVAAEPTMRALDRLFGWCLRHARGGGSIDVDLRDLVLALRVRTSVRCPPVAPETARGSLAVYFAQALFASQGGGLWCGAEADGTLVISIALPA